MQRPALGWGSPEPAGATNPTQPESALMFRIADSAPVSLPGRNFSALHFHDRGCIPAGSNPCGWASLKTSGKSAKGLPFSCRFSHPAAGGAIWGAIRHRHCIRIGHAAQTFGSRGHQLPAGLLRRRRRGQNSCGPAAGAGSRQPSPVQEPSIPSGRQASQPNNPRAAGIAAPPFR